MTFRDLAPALAIGLFGVARVGGGDLIVRAAQGRLLDWLPVGARLCDSPVFFGLDAELAELRDGRRERLDLPGLRLPPQVETPFAVTVIREPETGDLLVYAAADCGLLDFERQLADERRQSQILADQAASAGRHFREQAALYRDIVENVADLVLRLGPDLRISFVNRVACARLGLPEREIIGRAVDDLLDSAPEQRWTALFAETPARGLSFEQLLRGADGGMCWIWWRAHWVEDGAEYQAIGRDVTEMRRLRVESAARAEEARANAVMRERLRITHAIHDTLVHSLVALAPQIRLIRKAAGPDAPHRLTEELSFAEMAVRDGLAAVRTAIADLRSQPLEEGLGAALEALARRFGERTGVHVLLDFDARARELNAETADTLRRIVEEGLRNIELHAQATRVGVYLAAQDDGGVTLVIEDDGRGFDPDLAPAGHFGLIGMRERADMIGAAFRVDSEPGGGTRIVVIAPVARSD
jgi:PAS domain S-box-containing protein